jgi:4-aminobutyrate aminotransferase
LHTVLRNERDIAALIAEPIRNGPYIPAPDYWKEVRALCDEFSTLLIFDDIPTGLGKTGRLFNMEHFGIAPDITLLGKALGGAVAPLAAVIASARLDGTADMNLGYYTHEKNALSAAAGLATFRVIVDEQLAERAARLEPLVKARLDTLVAGTSVVANVRSIGLMFAVDLGEPDDEGAGMAQRLYYDLLKRGILPMPPKVNTLSFSAPLMIDENDLTGSLDILHSAVQML